MPRWNDKGANGKGDTNRSLSKAYNNGYDDIDYLVNNKELIESK